MWPHLKHELLRVHPAKVGRRTGQLHAVPQQLARDGLEELDTPRRVHALVHLVLVLGEDRPHLFVCD